jgi:ABC-type multidrug transport system fused ATPase/permease subunit
MSMEREEYPNRQFIADVWSILGKHRYIFSFWFTLRVISATALLVIPYALGKIIDFFTTYQRGGDLSVFYYWVILISVVSILSTVLRMVSKYYMGNIARGALQETRMKAFASLLNKTLAWHESENTGNKVQRINTGSKGFKTLMDFLFNDSAEVIVGIVGVTIVLITIGINYVIAVFAYIFIYLLFEYFVNKSIAKNTQKQNLHAETVSGKMTEYASNISTVKALGMKSAVRERAAAYERTMRELEREGQYLSTIKWMGIQTISAIAYAVFLLMLGFDVSTGILTVGSIAIFTVYIVRTQNALNTMSKQSDKVIDAKYSIHRLMPLLQEEKPKEGKPFPQWDKIVFDKVSFKYKDDLVLKEASFVIRKGEKVGIVGVSGQGKSTIMKLLLNLYQPTAGHARIGDIDTNDIAEEELAKHMSVVTQEVDLFNIALRENITIMNEKPAEELDKAVRLSATDTIIAKLPHGIDTLVGEKGVRLSGGEKQRVGIARAIYADPEILLLDEATSHLDSGTERLIQQNIKKHLKDKTVIAIAHRLSTLSSFDRILVLKDGRIVQQGTYTQLLRKKGEFSRLHKLQKSK